MKIVSKLHLALYFFITPLLIFAKTVTISTEYVYQIPENMSYDEAKETALLRARSQAIADEFGTYVSQSTNIAVQNVNGESSYDFILLGGSELKGEWIEDIDTPVYEFITNGQSVAVKVKIKGKIRDIKSTHIQIIAKLYRNGISSSYESDKFDSGDDIFASFQSPVSGFLAIYLIDNSNNAYCLLPYQEQNEGIFEVKSNKEYILFNPDYAAGVDTNLIDSLIVETDIEQERNRIIFIFSPNRFYKGVDKQTASDCPRSLSKSEFQKWLSDIKKRDTDLTIVEKQITIFKK